MPDIYIYGEKDVDISAISRVALDSDAKGSRTELKIDPDETNVPEAREDRGSYKLSADGLSVVSQ